MVDNLGSSIKRKSRLAVFEHVVQKEKRPRLRNYGTSRFVDDSSPSESELVIDDEDERNAKGRRTNAVRIRFKAEVLSLLCEWDPCGEVFGTYDEFNYHLIGHATSLEGLDEYECHWRNCPNPKVSTVPLLIRHVSYHGYVARLKNIGENVLMRNNLPDCTLKEENVVSVSSQGYTCEWEYCHFTYNTIFDFLNHMMIHIKNNPTGRSGTNEIIQCDWNGCNGKFSTQYKLQEHVRVHTKEKTVACPACLTLFSTKTKFCDHRKRQLKENLRSYQCSQCLKLFPSERLLSDHMRSHINQYKCTMCDMTCAKPSILAKHIRYRHLTERPFKCPHCSKTFVGNNNLKTHLLTHIEKPIKCDLCDFGCKSKVGLESHYSKFHEKIKSKYQCHVCQKFFSRGDALTKHLIKLHKFHWPSGHSRFRYRKDQDGICRLQTVRYESLEVTEEMIRSESMQPASKMPALTYDITRGNNEELEYKLTVVGSEDKSYKIRIPELEELKKVRRKNNNVVITIEDVDEDGNVLNTQVVESSEILVSNEPMSSNITQLNRNEGMDDTFSDTKCFEAEEHHLEEPTLSKPKGDVHYFSKEIIMNYDKFKIAAPKSEG